MEPTITLKSFFITITVMIVGTITVWKLFPEYLYLVGVFAIIIAVLGEFSRLGYHRRKSAGANAIKAEPTALEDDNEYHNDFSKVPAGTVDPDGRIPLPRNYLPVNPFLEFEEALKKDMENAGLEVEDTKEKSAKDPKSLNTK